MSKPIISDLHVHTTHSDGSMTVREVLDLAKFKGIDCIAITDHDIMSGVQDAIEYGREIGINVINGIELSSFSITSIHVLGYCLDINNPLLNDTMQELLLKRRERKDKILKKLERFNIFINEENLPTENVGRSHIARELRDSGYVSTIQEAFDKYLGENCLAFVPSSRLTPIDAIKLINECDGFSVIAHPLQLHKMGKLELLIQALIPYGLDGLEVYYPNYSEKEKAELLELAKKYRLIVTGGSDFHGQTKASTNILGASVCELPKEFLPYLN